MLSISGSRYLGSRVLATCHPGSVPKPSYWHIPDPPYISLFQSMVAEAFQGYPMDLGWSGGSETLDGYLGTLDLTPPKWSIFGPPNLTPFLTQNWSKTGHIPFWPGDHIRGLWYLLEIPGFTTDALGLAGIYPKYGVSRGSKKGSQF